MKQGGFMKDAIILFIITLISGLCLGGVYGITKEPIEKANMAAKIEAYKTVFTDAADFKASDSLKDAVKETADTMSTLGFGNVLVDDAVEAVDASGNVIGYVISSTSKDGFGGAISISVGITADGLVNGIEFLAIAETPGLGMNATNPEFKGQFAGKQVDAFVVTKAGASADNEIDAMSGATITSDAVANAVNAAVYFVNNCISK